MRPVYCGKEMHVLACAGDLNLDRASIDRHWLGCGTNLHDEIQRKGDSYGSSSPLLFANAVKLN